MRNYNLDPSLGSVLSDSIERNYLGRIPKVNQFIKYLESIDSNEIISLSSGWGTGKTFFVKQSDFIINESYDKENTKYKSIYYDAWASDYHSDPILALIFAMIKIKGIRFTDFRKGFIKEVVKSVTSALPLVPEINIEELSKRDIFDSIFNEENIKKKIHKMIDWCVKEDEKLILFVDELDRCNPEYTIKFLERCKHFFNHSNLIIVISANNKILQAVINNYYGEGIDSDKWLNKFFTRKYPYPEISVREYIEFTLEYRINDHYHFDKALDIIINYFNMSLREQNQLATYLAGFLEQYDPKNNDLNFWYREYLIFMLALYVSKNLLFNELINMKSSAKSEVMRLILSDENLSNIINYNRFYNRYHNGDKKDDYSEQDFLVNLLGIEFDYEIVTEELLKQYYNEINKLIGL